MRDKIEDEISPGHKLSLIPGDSPRKPAMNGHFIAVYYQQLNRMSDFHEIWYKYMYDK
jgi:hypothetical protein